jgi:hypothetical protein
MAGSYFTSQFEPAFRFEVPDGWTLDAESQGVVYLHRGTFPDDFVDLYLVAPGREPFRVADPPLSTAHRSGVFSAAPFPRDYLTYLGASPYLQAGEVHDDTLFGLSGRSVDAVVETPDAPFCGGVAGSCFSLFSYGRNSLSEQIEPRGAVMRVWELERDGRRLIVILAVPDAARLAAAVATLDAVAQQVRFL